jgi:uncharacterized RDD family membrane protein YckC
MEDVTRTSLATGVAADALCLPAGFTLGPYRIVRLLGRGGMGEVYEAEHAEHQRRVALKILTRRLEADDRQQFLSEGRIAASIAHPNTVYVFGSETIGGVSVIAMELLAGGTLKDLVDRDGPLAPAAAVDAILQVVAGLEAAELAGILHRDVKPHNCFTASDGTVKVGDFGLSISSSAREATGYAGVFQGTPQYAAPEQLRGEALDAGADIYAVGGTLYYLLTGRPPFDDQDFTTLVQRVKSETATSPRELAPNIPKELAAIVMRCLAKDRAARPATYAALAADLEPFSSVAPQPAPLGPRFIAGVVDAFLLTLLLIVVATPVQILLGRGPWVIAFQYLLFAAYFVATEGVSGASRGKALFGLQVVDRRGRQVGVGRAAARAALFLGALFAVATLRSWIKDLIGGAPANGDPGALASLTGITIWVMFAGAWFGGARRANGYAAIHDRLTGSRVVQTPKAAIRQRKAAHPIPPTVAGEAVGPYHQLLVQPDALPGGVVAGFDGILNRFVWLVWGEGGAPTPERRNLARPGRVRWLGSGERPRIWNAYEAVHGAPLVISTRQTRPWTEVRLWLHALAGELAAAEADGTTPVLGLDNVWITADSGARLVDWPKGGEPMESRRFLWTVAVRALQAVPGPLQVRLPLSARFLLDRLNSGTVSLADARDTLSKLCREPTEITPRRRAIPLLLCGGPAIIIGLVTIVAVIVNASRTSAELLTELSLFGGALQLSGAVAVASAAIFRGGVLMRFSGIGLITRSGSEAPRWRAVLRAVAAWAPAAIFAAIVIPYRKGSLQAEPIVVVEAVVAFGVFAAGVVYALSHPARGWQDRIAGTWLVPR